MKIRVDSHIPQRQEPKINLSVPKPAPRSQNDQAVLLIRAMINAAKVDGEIFDDEQKIFSIKSVILPLIRFSSCAPNSPDLWRLFRFLVSPEFLRIQLSLFSI